MFEIQTAADLLSRSQQTEVTREATPLLNRADRKEQIREAASTRWAEILSIVANVSIDIFDGDHHPCPKCGGEDRFRFIDPERGACFCNQCFSDNNGDGFAAIQWLTGRAKHQFSSTLADVEHIVGSTSRSNKPTPRSNLNDKSISDGTADLYHQVYSQLLKLCKLSPEHRKSLCDRGFSEAEIERLGYRSSPKAADFSNRLVCEHFPKTMWERIRSEVPGIYPKLAGGRGLLIPTRDVHGRIVGLRVRLDKPAKNGNRYRWLSRRGQSRAKSHCSLPPEQSSPEPNSLRLTEGEFKADLSTLRTGVRTVSVPGVSTWKTATTVVEDSCPSTIILAFDLDATSNDGVAKAVIELWEYATTLGWNPSVQIETWPDQHKAIDDAIAAGATIERLGFKESAEYVSKLREKVGGTDLKLTDLLDDLADWEEPHDPARLARINVRNYAKLHNGRLVFWCGAWWKYKTGQWRKIGGDDDLDAKIRGSVNDELLNIAIAQQKVEDDKSNRGCDKKAKQIKKRLSTNSLIKNVIGEMRPQCYLSSRIEMPSMLDGTIRRFLSLKNGMVDLDQFLDGRTIEDSFCEHSSTWFSGVQLAFDYRANVSRPKFDKYLKEALPDEPSRRLMQEFSGYLFYPGNPFQRFAVIEGDGGTGKGVFVSGILPALVGKANVSNVKLDGFGGNQFALANTVGKALNVDSDVNQYAKFSEGLFKQFSAGEAVQIELKGKDPLSVKPTAKICLAWNNRPKIRDKSLSCPSWNWNFASGEIASPPEEDSDVPKISKTTFLYRVTES